MSDTNYYTFTSAELLTMCAKRGVKGVTEHTTRDGLVNALKRHDRDVAFVGILQGMAAQLGLDAEGVTDRQQLTALVEPAMLAKLTKDGYFVKGGQGKPFNVGDNLGEKLWVLTGVAKTAAGRIEVGVADVTPGYSNTHPSPKRVLYLYQLLYAPDSIQHDERIKKWLGLNR